MDDKIYDEIVMLSDQAEQLIETDQYDPALAIYKRAFDLIPDPKENWEATEWVATAIGDIYFLTDDYEQAIEWLLKAYTYPETVDNPFVNLRLGQTYFELKKLDDANEYLLRAYMLDGPDIFDDEDDKYFSFLKQHNKL